MPVREFGDWLPDLEADSALPHLRDASGCLPAGRNTYRPMKRLPSFSSLDPGTGMDDRCRGIFPMRDKDNAAHMYGGDDEKLYQLLGENDWTDYSRVGGYTTATTSTRWRFTQFGDRVIATNALDEIQYLDASSAATAFDDLAGSPGLAKFVATYGEFVFLGALGSNGNSIKWSAIGDSEGWTAGVNLSDEQEFADGGNITGFATTKAALYVFQEKCIRRVLFVGGDVIMQIDKLIENIGCIEPNSLVQYGQRCFFLSEDGWYMWDFESQPVAIGNERFDRWFLSDSARGYWYSMSTAVDPKNRLFACAYASTGAGADYPDTIFFFNYELGRASYARQTLEILGQAIGLAVSLDDLTGNLDTDYTFSFDDPLYQGGALYFAAVRVGDHKIVSFSGQNWEATFELSPGALFDGRRASIAWVKPLTDASGATAAAGAKVKPSDAITFQSQVAQQASGRCPQRGAEGFYHAAKVVIPQGETWTWARGVEFAAGSARGVR
jgi:hypothetical protein